MSDKCPTCGSSVTVQSSGDGTSYYVPREQQLEEALRDIASITSTTGEDADDMREIAREALNPPITKE